MKVFIQKIRAAWSVKKIHNKDDLKDFLYSYSAKNAGQLIIKYAQKRLGKIHYNLTRDDDNYNREIVRCQIAIHAEILADMGHLLARLSKLPNVATNEVLKNSLIEAHDIYVTSSPDWYQGSSQMTSKHLNRENQELKELASQTGAFLYKLLPMTEDLRKSNVIIFQNQIRLIYIQFLEQFSKRLTIEKLQTIVKP